MHNLILILALILSVSCKKTDSAGEAPKPTEPGAPEMQPTTPVPAPAVEPAPVPPPAPAAQNNRDEVIDKLQVELNELDAKLADLEARAKTKSTAAREEAIAKLKAARAEADASLKTLRAESAEAWDKAAASTREAVSRVKAAAAAAENELTKE